MSNVIHVISDFAPGDLALAEVMEQILHCVPGANIITSSVKPFDTVSCGFVLGQLSFLCPEDWMKKAIFVNCAPRRDQEVARAKNEGEGLIAAVLDNDVTIVAVNSGYSLSFVKDRIVTLVGIPPTEYRGSQFRSRDFFPEIFQKVLKKGISAVGEEVSLDCIPKFPEKIVAYVDNFGNLKTSIRASAVFDNLTPGQQIEVTINERTKLAEFQYASFAVTPGVLAFAPGSSGGSDPYMELFLRGDSASELFGKPGAGTPINMVAAYSFK